MDAKRLCMNLLEQDYPDDVVALLRSAGYWDDEFLWRPVGDNPNNRAIIGNQQEDAISALAEKITNSIDAVLINLAREHGIGDLRGPGAPKSITEAVRRFLLDGDSRATASLYQLWADEGLPRDLVDRASRFIWVSVTGPKDGPSITVADRGEGQCPDAFPSTFLSLIGAKSNDGEIESYKAGIRFVQGQFNMGGSGVYPFGGGSHKLQLLISRRNPALLGDQASSRDHQWGCTIIRARQREQLGSIYEYLAPVDAGREAGQKSGQVLSFAADEFPLLPESPPRTVPNQAYAQMASFGSLIKLYEYQFRGTGILVGSALRRDGLMRNLELVLPESPIPFRIVEARDYRGKPGSFQLPVFGLRHRVERLAQRMELESRFENDADDDDESEGSSPTSKLELEGPPVSGQIDIHGYRVPWSAYVFRENASDVTRRGSHALIYHVNGQKHAHASKSFFSKEKVGRRFLAARGTILVLVDCSELSVGALEQLFKPSRDRINRTQFTEEVEGLLSDALKTSPELRELENQQRQRVIAKRVADPAPVRDVLERLIRDTPALAQFFRRGVRMPGNPFPTEGAGDGSGAFTGKPHPSFVRFDRHRTEIERTAALGSQARFSFETDAVDEYFTRPDYRGTLEVRLQGVDGAGYGVTGSRGSLHDGAFTYALVLPDEVRVGDVLDATFTVSDPTLLEPFTCSARLTVVGPQPAKPGGTGKKTVSNNPGGGKGGRSSLDDLDVRICRREPTDGYDTWPDATPPWTEATALTVMPGSSDGEDLIYFVNADNIHLLDYQKALKSDADIRMAEERFKWSNVLLAFSIVRWHGVLEKRGEFLEADDVEEDPEDAWSLPRTVEQRDQLIRTSTEATAALILPTLDALTKFDMDAE